MIINEIMYSMYKSDMQFYIAKLKCLFKSVDQFLFSLMNLISSGWKNTFATFESNTQGNITSSHIIITSFMPKKSEVAFSPLIVLSRRRHSKTGIIEQEHMQGTNIHPYAPERLGSFVYEYAYAEQHLPQFFFGNFKAFGKYFANFKYQMIFEQTFPNLSLAFWKRAMLVKTEA